LGGVKTHESRTVRLPRSISEELAADLAGRPRDPEALVFTAPLGGPLRPHTWVKSFFKPAVRAVGLPEGLRLYDLRHTCASLLIAQGASVKAVQAQLGHATASITLDTYGHLFPSEMEAVADRLEQARTAALANRERTPRGPAVVNLSEAAGRYAEEVVSEFRTSFTPVAGHCSHLELRGERWACRSWSLLPWWSSGAARARSRASTGSPAAG
jgi:hypothetical protein